MLQKPDILTCYQHALPHGLDDRAGNGYHGGMIIGLTGKNGAGKGEVARYLQERGFHYYSLSDVLREEAAKEGKPITRDVLVDLGNRLRSQHGPSVLAEKIFAFLLNLPIDR